MRFGGSTSSALKCSEAEWLLDSVCQVFGSLERILSGKSDSGGQFNEASSNGERGGLG